jgi:hypothetical protein
MNPKGFVKTALQSIDRYGNRWLVLLAVLTIVVSIFSPLIANVPVIGAPIYTFLSGHLIHIWLIALTILLALLYLSFWRISRRFTTSFGDKFRHDLSLWDMEGKWLIPEKGTLLVRGWGEESGTRSDAGGITKVGAMWDNYILYCDFRLIRTCLGVIVRASDLNNYYMFQIAETAIYPHRRWSSPVFSSLPDAQPKLENQSISGKFLQVDVQNVQIGWLLFDPPTPVKLQLQTWYRLKIRVEGASVSIYINDELYLHQDNFLGITMGRIGFRNHQYEEALVRNVRVRPLS